MLHVAFAGTFPASLEQPVRHYLTIPCEIVVTSEADILPKMPEIDVLVTMGLTAEMARAATRLKLVQVPGAGVDRIDRSALPADAVLANTYGHEVGIARIRDRGNAGADPRVFAARRGAARGRLAKPLGSRHGTAAALA